MFVTKHYVISSRLLCDIAQIVDGVDDVCHVHTELGNVLISGVQLVTQWFVK